MSMPDRSLPTNPKIAPRSCPACAGTTNHEFRFKVNGCDIWQCRSCGLGQAESIGFDPASYYTGEYFSGQRSDGYADYLGAEPILRREFARSVRFIRQFCDNGKLLEIGCAYGLFLKEAQQYYEVAGIELAEAAADHARRSGLNVLSGSADEENMDRLGSADVRSKHSLTHSTTNPGSWSYCAGDVPRCVRPLTSKISTSTTLSLPPWTMRVQLRAGVARRPPARLQSWPFPGDP